MHTGGLVSFSSADYMRNIISPVFSAALLLQECGCVRWHDILGAAASLRGYRRYPVALQQCRLRAQHQIKHANQQLRNIWPG
jgi:hypothetical protein